MVALVRAPEPHLRADRVLATLDKLQSRISARFPDAGLVRVCADLIATARFSSRDAAQLARPHLFWRLAALALIVLGVAAQVAAFRFMRVDDASLTAPELVQGLEAAVNLLILFGGAIWFLLTLEERIKRRRALDALHRLRSLAHVIDMHQLTKDPMLATGEHEPTAASPARAMSRYELTRYLDYCAEMLALIGKLAALYADEMRDPFVVDTVNDLESLTANLATKIWQKITIVGAGPVLAPPRGPTPS